jgi:hypothetical protein
MYSCRMKRLILKGLVIAAFLFLAKDQALGCVCVDMGDSTESKVANWVKESALVFSGDVVKLEQVRGKPEVIVTFSVDEIWKGGTSPTIQVKDSMGSCGNRFLIGMRYIVYASASAKALMAEGCLGTGRRNDPWSQEQIRILGRGKAPEKVKPEKDSSN